MNNPNKLESVPEGIEREEETEQEREKILKKEREEAEKEEEKRLNDERAEKNKEDIRKKLEEVKLQKAKAAEEKKEAEKEAKKKAEKEEDEKFVKDSAEQILADEEADEEAKKAEEEKAKKIAEIREKREKGLMQFINDDVFKLSNKDIKAPRIPSIDNVKNNTKNVKNMLLNLSNFFPIYTYHHMSNQDDKREQLELDEPDIINNKEKIKEKLDEYKKRFEHTFLEGKKNIIEKRKKKEENAREDELIFAEDVKKAGGNIINYIILLFGWIVNTITSTIRHMLTTGWNRTITGFIILIILIILIFAIPKMKKSKPSGGEKEKDRNIFTLLFSIPQDIGIAFNNFRTSLWDFADSLNNTRETINNTISAMNAEEPDLKDRGRESEGRGSDSLFHIKGEYIGATLKPDYIYNIYKPRVQNIKGKDVGSKIVDNKYELDCTGTDNTIFDKDCKLIPEKSTLPRPTNNYDETDYIKIELKEGS